MKKALSFILAAVLLLSALPVAVYAVETDDLADTGFNTIDDVYVYGVTSPIAGTYPSYQASVSSYANYEINKQNGTYVCNGVSWYNVTDNKMMKPDVDKFEANKLYRIEILLEPKYSTYSFSNSVKGTVYEHKADIERYIASSIGVRYTFPHTASHIINDVSVSGVVVPYGGNKPSYSASVPSGKGYKLINYDSDYTSNGLSWHDENDKPVKKTDTFIAGRDYTLSITLYPSSDDYIFDVDTPVTRTVNGSSNVTAYRGKDSYGDTYITLECTYTCGGRAIHEVKVTGVVEPVAGQRPNYTANIQSGNGYIKRVFSSEKSENGVDWANADKNRIYKTHTFTAGDQYYFYLYLYPESNEYYFDFSNDFKGSVNGSQDDLVVYRGVDSEGIEYIKLERSYTCDPAPSGKTINGTQTSFLNSLDNVRIQLSLGGYTKYRATSTGNVGNFSFGGVTNGNYTMRVSKPNHVTRTYNINVNSDKTLSVKIHPYGDIDGDGQTTTFDFALANSHAKGVNTLKGYEFDCANTDGEGDVTTFDAALINSHAKGVSLLY